MRINIDKFQLKKQHLCIISIILFSTTNIFASDDGQSNYAPNTSLGSILSNMLRSWYEDEEELSEIQAENELHSVASISPIDEQISLPNVSPNQFALVSHHEANAKRQKHEDSVKSYVRAGTELHTPEDHVRQTAEANKKEMHKELARHFEPNNKNLLAANAGNASGADDLAKHDAKGNYANFPTSVKDNFKGGAGHIKGHREGHKNHTKAINEHKNHGKHHHGHHNKSIKQELIKQNNNYRSGAGKLKDKTNIWTNGFFGWIQGRSGSNFAKVTGSYDYYNLGFNHKINNDNSFSLIYSYNSDVININNELNSKNATQGSKVALHLNHKLTKNIFSDFLLGYGVYNQQANNIVKAGDSDKMQFNEVDVLVRFGQYTRFKSGVTIIPTVGMHYVNKVQSGPSQLGLTNLGNYSVSAILGTKIITNVKLNKYKLQPSLSLNLLQAIKNRYRNNVILDSQKIYSTYNIGVGMELINSNVFAVDLAYDLFINKQTYNHSGSLTLKLAL